MLPSMSSWQRSERSTVLHVCSVHIVNISICMQVNRCIVIYSWTPLTGKILSYECNLVGDPVQGPVNVVLIVLYREVRSSE